MTSIKSALNKNPAVANSKPAAEPATLENLRKEHARLLKENAELLNKVEDLEAQNEELRRPSVIPTESGNTLGTDARRDDLLS